MTRRIWNLAASIAACLLIAACLTINVYFPAAAVQQAADQFVNDVQTGAATPPATLGTPPPSPEKKQSFLSLPFIAAAHAAEAPINLNTPEANRLKANMRSRVAEINAFKEKGAVGENKKGLLEERDIKDLTLPERAKLKKLIKAENNDRLALYEEVVDANHYPSEKSADIHAIFAKSWQAISKVGSWIQKEDGAWVKK